MIDEHDQEPTPAGAGAATDGLEAPPRQPEPETSAAAASAPAGDGIRPTDRVFCVGFTRSGKSELANHLFSVFRWQRFLYDSKDEWAVDGTEPVSDVESIDWKQPVIHYRPPSATPAEAGRVFSVLNQRSRIIVAVHETTDLCGHSPNQTPTPVRDYLTKGAAHGRGFIGASQRPAGSPMSARTEAAHIFFVVPRLTPIDLKPLAQEVGMSFEQLAQRLDATQAKYGDYSFMWFNRRTRELLPCEPLADHVRAQTIVHRTTIA